ncbi:MAG: DUF3426 domain-containing protein, partial [Candidatus Binatia bacterium]
FQCTQKGCGHVFSYSPPLLAGMGPPTSTTGSHTSERTLPPPSIPEDIFTIPSDDSFLQEDPILTKPIEPLDEEPSDQPEIAEAFVPTDMHFYADTEAAEEEQRSRDLPLSVWSKPEAIISPGIFLLFLGSLILSFGLLSAYCFYHPENTEAVLAQIPVLNTLVAGERFSAQHIILSNLDGRYQLTKDNQKVFTVSGVATNNATIPAQTIQLEGAIYDATGRVVGRRLIFCGTNIAPDRLANLTLREIGALQDLVPPKQFHVVAGSAVKFLIVFPAPSPAVAEFSGRVVAAQFGGE